MELLRVYRYRLSPSSEQTARLEAWQDALRFLWNAALEQYLMARRLSRADRARVGWPSYYGQCKQLTELRAEFPWLNDVPVGLCQQVLQDLERSWKRCWSGKGTVGAPRFKSKKRGDTVGMRQFCKTLFRVIPAPAVDPARRRGRERIGHLRFPKIGPIEGVFYRDPVGTPKSCALILEHGEWWCSITCVREVPDPTPSTNPPIALDRGVVNLIADSNGRLVENPRFLTRALPKIKRAQRVVARRKKGSKNQQKARKRVARLHRRVLRQRDHLLHVESKRYAENHGVIVLENLKVRQMSKSARGTSEEPGVNVRAKAGLNRAILDAGWSKFDAALGWKTAERGGRVIRVNPAYSSQTCSVCGHVDPTSRHSQSEFHCVSCGHRENADVNAAKVLLRRGFSGAEACGGDPVAGPMKRERRPQKAPQESARPIGGPEALPGLR